MCIDFLSLVFADPELKGRTVFYGLENDQRYYHENSVNLMNRGIYKQISSAMLFGSLGCYAGLIFFDNMHFGILPAGEYNGSFIQITNPLSSGSFVNVNKLADYKFDDKTASLIGMKSYSHIPVRLSFRDLFYEKWIETIDRELGSDAERRGEPLMTWEMWPQGVPGLNSQQCYLKIHQPITILVPCWWDYKASITYHIYLFLDANGSLRGRCARWAYWIEGGVKHGQIESRLAPKVINGAAKLTERIGEELEEISALKFADIYYLPGRQLAFPSPQIITGNTLDDVTLVLEF